MPAPSALKTLLVAACECTSCKSRFILPAEEFLPSQPGNLLKLRSYSWKASRPPRIMLAGMTDDTMLA